MTAYTYRTWQTAAGRWKFELAVQDRSPIPNVMSAEIIHELLGDLALGRLNTFYISEADAINAALKTIRDLKVRDQEKINRTNAKWQTPTEEELASV